MERKVPPPANKHKRNHSQQSNNSFSENTTYKREWNHQDFHALIVQEIERAFQYTFDVDISICEYPLVTTIPFQRHSFDCRVDQCRPTASPEKSASTLVFHPQLFDKSLLLQNLHQGAPVIKRSDLLAAWKKLGNGSYGTVFDLSNSIQQMQFYDSHDDINIIRLHDNGPPLAVKLQRLDERAYLTDHLVEEDLYDSSFAIATRFPFVMESVTLYTLNRYEQTVSSFLPDHQPRGCVPRIFYTACVRQGKFLFHAIVMERLTDATSMADYFNFQPREPDEQGEKELLHRQFLTNCLHQFKIMMKNMQESILRVWNFDATTRNMLVTSPFDEIKPIQFHMLDFGFVFLTIPTTWICVSNEASRQVMKEKCRNNSIAFKIAMVLQWDKRKDRGAYNLHSTLVDAAHYDIERFGLSYHYELGAFPNMYEILPKEIPPLAKIDASALYQPMFAKEDGSDSIDTAIYDTMNIGSKPPCMTVLKSPCNASLGSATAQAISATYDVRQLYQRSASRWRKPETPNRLPLPIHLRQDTLALANQSSFQQAKDDSDDEDEMETSAFPYGKHSAERVDVLQTSPRRLGRLDSPPVGGGRTIHLKGGSQVRPSDQRSNIQPPLKKAMTDVSQTSIFRQSENHDSKKINNENDDNNNNNNDESSCILL
jgi:hypothetical protein